MIFRKRQEIPTHQMVILSSHGDTVLATWDPADEMTTEQANREFDRIVRYSVMIRNDESTGHIGVAMKEFDPLARRIVVQNPFTGG